MIVTGAVIFAFALFAVVLAYADRRTNSGS